VLVGKKGGDLEKIKKFAEKLEEKKSVFVKVLETDKPDLDAELVAQSMARQVENRAAFKRVVKKAIQSVMKYGAMGVKVSIAGRLNGVDIARTETYKEGSTPLQSLRANIDYASVQAQCSYGVVGIKVWIYKK
jgi:small subunit ribosomal protein S3